MTKRKTPKWLAAAKAGGEQWAPGTEWLSRLLGRTGGVPGDTMRALAAGRVRVNGVEVREPMTPVPAGAVVTVDDVVVDRSAATRVLMLNKPAGVVTDAKDPEGRGTVFEVLKAALVPELLPYDWHAVGRLDRETTGLLLFTNDPRFVAHATAPDTELPKTYLVTTQEPVSDAALEQLRSGVELPGGPAKAVSAERRAEKSMAVVITEGRHHQVRRMCAAVRLGVRALHRSSVGTLALDVPVGGLRELTAVEIAERLGFGPDAKLTT
jgi:23S rRNA pseudouridine2605 synthase/16S rRNA pseudouridine516 synthase